MTDLYSNAFKFVLFAAVWLAACGPGEQAVTTSTPRATETLRASTADSPTATTAPTATRRVPDAAKIAQHLDEYLGKLSAQDKFSGVVFVARDGQVIYEKAFGKSKKPGGKPLTPTTIFRIASVTKQITSAAILHLQAQGKLKVQDKICQYLESCPGGWQEITFHHLMTSTSGLKDDLYLDLSKPHKLPELIALMQKAPMRSRSGGDYFHNTWGFILLAHLIERISGSSYEEFVSETYFDPLGMMDTGSTIDDANLPGYAVNVDYSNLRGGADLYSTAQDLYLWTQQLDRWQKDANSEYQPMFQEYVSLSEPGFGDGYGLTIATTMNQHWVGHPGNGLGAYASLVGRFLDSDTTLIMLSNNGYVPAEDAELYKILLGE